MDNPPSLDSNTIVRLAWIALLALATTAVSFTITAIIAFMRAPQTMNPAYTFSRMFERAKALQMITVILIVVAAAFLALLHIIDSNGVVGILSGIAGYVLGGIQREPKEEEKKDDKKGKDEQK